MDFVTMFCNISKFLFDVQPTEETIKENAELGVKLVLKKLGQERFDAFMVYISNPKEIRSEKLKDFTGGDISGFYYHMQLFDNINRIFDDNEIFALINLCTLPLSCIRQLRQAEMHRYSAYARYAAEYEPTSEPRSISMANFLFALIQNQKFIDASLETINTIN